MGKVDSTKKSTDKKLQNAKNRKIEMATKCQQMMQNMIRDTINQLEQNGALKITTEEAFAIFEMEAPKKVSKRGRAGRPAMSKGEKAFKKLVKEAQAQETACAKNAFRLWTKGVNAQKKAAQKEAEKEQKAAAKAAEKEQKAAEKAAAKALEKAEKDAAKALEKERKAAAKAAEKAEKDALKALAKAEKEAADAIAALNKRPRGRSPKGQTWNAEKGDWVPEISLGDAAISTE